MTVIAFDGRYLAADSLETRGDYRVASANKIIEIVDPYRNGGQRMGYVGCAGDRQDRLAFVRWLQQGSKPDKQPTLSEHFSALYVSTGGQPARYEHRLVWWPVETPYAIGCAWTEALIAMRCGKSAKEAVEMVCEFNVYCGGPVVVVDTKAHQA